MEGGLPTPQGGAQYTAGGPRPVGVNHGRQPVEDLPSCGSVRRVGSSASHDDIPDLFRALLRHPAMLTSSVKGSKQGPLSVEGG